MHAEGVEESGDEDCEVLWGCGGVSEVSFCGGDVDETTDLRHGRGGATVFGGPLHGFASVGDAEGGVLF